MSQSRSHSHSHSHSVPHTAIPHVTDIESELNSSGRISRSITPHSVHIHAAVAATATTPTTTRDISMSNPHRAPTNAGEGEGEAEGDAGINPVPISKWEMWGHWDRLAPTDFLTSGFVHSHTLLAFRIICALWLPSTAIVIGVLEWGPSSNGVYLGETLSFMHYCLTGLYFVGMVMMTYRERMLYRQCQSYDLSLIPRDRLPSFTRFLWVHYELMCVCTMIVTIIYWSMLFKGNFTWSTFHLHAIQTICMLTETFLNRLIFVPFHVFFCIFFGIIYMVFAIIIRYAQGPWIYGFLDWDANRIMSPLMYPGVLLLVVIIFFAYTWLARGRNNLITKRQHYINPQQADDIRVRLNTQKRPQSYSGLGVSGVYDDMTGIDPYMDRSHSRSTPAAISKPADEVELSLFSCFRSSTKHPASPSPSPSAAIITPTSSISPTNTADYYAVP